MKFPFNFYLFAGQSLLFLVRQTLSLQWILDFVYSCLGRGRELYRIIHVSLLVYFDLIVTGHFSDLYQWRSASIRGRFSISGREKCYTGLQNWQRLQFCSHVPALIFYVIQMTCYGLALMLDRCCDIHLCTLRTWQNTGNVEVVEQIFIVLKWTDPQ